VRSVQGLAKTEVDSFRQPGQGGDADNQPRDLRAELLAAEAVHQARKNGTHVDDAGGVGSAQKRPLQLEQRGDSPEEEDSEAKRRRILEETRDIDADSDGADSDSSEEESDEEDETAELMRELEKIKRERAEEKAKEVRRASDFQESLV
jgi:protein CWC15